MRRLWLSLLLVPVMVVAAGLRGLGLSDGARSPDGRRPRGPHPGRRRPAPCSPA